MAQIIKMQREKPREAEVVDLLNSLLEKARRGEITGIMYATTAGEGLGECGLCGDYAEDLGFAMSSACEGITRLTSYKTRKLAEMISSKMTRGGCK